MSSWTERVEQLIVEHEQGDIPWHEAHSELGALSLRVAEDADKAGRELHVEIGKSGVQMGLLKRELAVAYARIVELEATIARMIDKESTRDG